jgi:hypothetical protein
MDETIIFVSRFLHLTGSAIGIGGLVAAATLLPKLDETARSIAARQVGKWVGIGLTLAVLTGIYNMLHALQIHGSGNYEAIVMAKAMLGLLVFLGSIFVFHPSPAFKAFSDRRALWSAILLVAALLVVALGVKLHTFSMPADPKGGMLQELIEHR